MIFIYSTYPSRKEAKQTAERLLREKLAACVNIFPVDSLYIWKGKIVKDKEFAAIIKTKKANFKKVEKFILENHTYETPAIIEIPLSRITQKYLNWLNKNL